MTRPKISENFVTVSQFAKLKGVTTQAIRKAIKEKRIWAEKVGCQWIIGRNQEYGE